MKVGEAEARLRQALRRRWRRDALFLAVAAAVVGFDQLTKYFVRQGLAVGESWPQEWPVHFTHVVNTGAAFGILEGQSGFLVVTTIVGLAAIALYYRFPPLEHPLLPAAVGLLLGGALGNLVDRLHLGHVIDFVDFPHYPAFNVADSSIVVAIVVLLGLLAFVQPSGGGRRL